MRETEKDTLTGEIEYLKAQVSAAFNLNEQTNSILGCDETIAQNYLVKPDSNERFQVGPPAKLTGAYNINKGYAVFKQVKELANSGEYYIVEKGTKYGLSVYDHIVLDASTVSDGQIVYQ